MVKAEFTKEFQAIFSKIKEESAKLKIIKQIEKIKTNPEVGKPMRYNRNGTRELYIKPFRLSYIYSHETDTVRILDLYHKDEQ